MYSPLEHFKIIVYAIKTLTIGNYVFFFSFNVITLYFILIFLAFFLLIYYPVLRFYIIPVPWQLLIERVYRFVLTILQQQITNCNVLEYFPLFLFLFLFIFLANFIGLFPYAYTLTANIFLTLLFGLSSFIGFALLGFTNKRLNYLSMFVPTGLPIMLVYFLIFIEIGSYLIRPFSLSIRLFANMLAGHTLISILASFIVFLLSSKYFLLSLLPILFLNFVIILEFGIVLIQSYVFISLLAIYASDAYWKL